MIKIDYEKMLKDMGLFETFKKALIENAKLSEKDSELLLKSSINNHANKMNNVLGGFETFFNEQKSKNLNDPEMNDIDKKLDDMIVNIQNNYKQFEKENEIK